MAARQHGLVTYQQLLECGFSRQAIWRMVKAAMIQRVRHGVYRLCGVPATWRSAQLAAVLSAGKGAVLSHRSAAALWGMADRHALDVIEITSPYQCRQPGVTGHRCPLDVNDRTVHEHIPVTTPARTLIDLAGALDERALGKMLDQALRHDLTTLRAVSAGLARVPAVQGRWGPTRVKLAAVLALRGVGYHAAANDWEREIDPWFDRSALPPARRQYRVRVGGRRYTLDRAIPELKVGIEWSGRGPHGTRSQFEYDSDRRSRLQAAGWCVLDFHYYSDPEFIAETVTSVCAIRAGRRLPEQITRSGG